jgi:hypothetical protein
VNAGKDWSDFQSCLKYVFLVNVKCGAKIAENNTYFESGGKEKGSCVTKVYKVKESIVQVFQYILLLKLLKSLDTYDLWENTTFSQHFPTIPQIC